MQLQRQRQTEDKLKNVDTLPKYQVFFTGSTTNLYFVEKCHILPYLKKMQEKDPRVKITSVMQLYPVYARISIGDLS